MGSKYSNSGLPQRLTTSGVTVLEVPANNRQQLIVSASLVNTTTTEQTCNGWIVNSGDAVADDKLIMVEQSVPAKESVSIDELLGKVLTSGQALIIDCSANDSVNVLVGTTDLF